MMWTFTKSSTKPLFQTLPCDPDRSGCVQMRVHYSAAAAIRDAKHSASERKGIVVNLLARLRGSALHVRNILDMADDGQKVSGQTRGTHYHNIGSGWDMITDKRCFLTFSMRRNLP
jgi:hypothetical protein